MQHVKVGQQGGNSPYRFLTEQIGEHSGLLGLIDLGHRLEHLVNGALGVRLHAPCDFVGIKTQGLERHLLRLGGGAAGGQGQGEVLHARSRDILSNTHTGQRRTHCRQLPGIQTGDFTQRANGRHDVRNLRGTRRAGIAQIVDLVSQGNDFFLIEFERRAPLGHHRAGLFCRLIKSNAHFYGILGELAQILPRNTRLATRRHNLCNAVCRHWQLL